MLRYIYLLIFTLNVAALLAAQEGERRDPNYTAIRATRLVTDAEHTAFLKDTLATASNSVMISTYNVSPKRLFDEGIGQAIIDAAERGVSVYVYYENRPYYSKEDYADLEAVASYCAVFDENANHSKCVIKDKSTVVIGSHNWLSDPWEGSSNGSMVITGGLALGLINDVWQGIRFYQSIEYGNERGVRKFLNDRDAFSTGEYQFSSGQFLYTLRTPEAHGIFLGDVFQRAKASILLFSPFIRLAKLKETFSSALLESLQQRGVSIKIITLPSPCDRVPEEQRSIFALLNRLSTNYVNFSYVIYPKFHAKTLVADDLICEGSFNWLSAVTQIDHNANNFEMSVAVKGDIGSSMIQEFEKTDLGKFVLSNPKIAQPLSLKREASIELKEKRQFVGEKKTPRTNQVSDILEPPFDPRKRAKVIPTQVPQNFDREIRIFSGEKFGIAGFCVRFNKGDYLREGQDIVYFVTPEEAKQAAYEVWRK